MFKISGVVRSYLVFHYVRMKCAGSNERTTDGHYWELAYWTMHNCTQFHLYNVTSQCTRLKIQIFRCCPAVDTGIGNGSDESISSVFALKFPDDANQQILFIGDPVAKLKMSCFISVEFQIT